MPRAATKSLVSQPKPVDEKLTINLGCVDLGQIDLLVKPAVTLDFYQVAKRGTQHSAAAADFRRVLVDALPALIA